MRQDTGELLTLCQSILTNCFLVFYSNCFAPDRKAFRGWWKPPNESLAPSYPPWTTFKWNIVCTWWGELSKITFTPIMYYSLFFHRAGATGALESGPTDWKISSVLAFRLWLLLHWAADHAVLTNTPLYCHFLFILTASSTVHLAPSITYAYHCTIVYPQG